MSRDEDDYGRRRADDYAYANFGNKNVPEPEKPMTGITKMLVAAGMDMQDARETGPAIVTLMDKMGPETPLAQQERMVKNFMTHTLAQQPELVSAITEAALGQMKWKPVETKPATQAVQNKGPGVSPAKLKV